MLREIKDDQRIWDLFKNGITCTLNQVDSDNGTHQAKRFGLKSFEEGAFLAAAIRPSFDSWRDQFLDRKPYTTGSKILDKVLSSKQSGLSFILFQESLMTYFEWLGVTPAESIGLIKKISKKKIKPEDFQALEKRLKDNWINNTGSDDGFEETWQMIQSCLSYSFCSAHACSTSLDMCYGAYLKVHYPIEYYTVCLNNYIGDETRTNKLTKELAYFGLSLQGVKFGHSKSLYAFDKSTNTIYKGLASIKYINETVPNELYELSQQHNYTNFVDLLFDMREQISINARMLDILIKIDFFEQFGNINKLLWITEKFDKIYKKKSIKKDIAKSLFIAEEDLRQFSDSETETRVDEINLDAFLYNRGLTKDDLDDCKKYKYITNESGERTKVENGYSFAKVFKKFEITDAEKERFATKTVIGKFDGIHTRELLIHLFNKANFPDILIKHKIKYQEELLGYVDYVNPDLDPRYFVVERLDTKYSPKFAAYCLKNGRTCDMQVRKTIGKSKKPRAKTCFSERPFQNGDIIYLKDWGKEPKMRMTENGWEKDNSTMINWLYDYEVTDI